MKYSIVLFDLDGTLLDTLDDLAASANAAISAQGFPARTREEVRSFIGNGVVKLLERSVGMEEAERLGLPAPIVDMEKLCADFRGYYKLHCQDQTAPYPLVMQLLADLKARGATLGVVSNKADFATQLLCKDFFGELLDVVVGENEAAGIMRKPAADSLLLAIRKARALRGEAESMGHEDVVYIGDSEVDIFTARNAGVDHIGVTWGMKDKDFLAENGATVLVDSVEELMGILL